MYQNSYKNRMVYKVIYLWIESENEQKIFYWRWQIKQEKICRFLRTIIDNSDKYKRNNVEKSYVIAVDSSWGTGKTYFTDMFENYLLGFDGKNLG